MKDGLEERIGRIHQIFEDPTHHTVDELIDLVLGISTDRVQISLTSPGRDQLIVSTGDTRFHWDIEDAPGVLRALIARMYKVCENAAPETLRGNVYGFKGRLFRTIGSIREEFSIVGENRPTQIDLLVSSRSEDSAEIE